MYRQLEREAKLAQAGYADALEQVLEGPDVGEFTCTMQREIATRAPIDSTVSIVSTGSTASTASTGTRTGTTEWDLTVENDDDPGDNDGVTDAHALRREAIRIVFGADDDDDDLANSYEHKIVPLYDGHGRGGGGACQTRNRRSSSPPGPAPAPAPTLAIRSNLLSGLAPGAYSIQGTNIVARHSSGTLAPIHRNANEEEPSSVNIEGLHDAMESHTEPQKDKPIRMILTYAIMTMGLLAALGAGLAVGLSGPNANYETSPPTQTPASAMQAILEGCDSYGAWNESLRSILTHAAIKAKNLTLRIPPLNTLTEYESCQPQHLALWWLADDGDDVSDENFSAEAKYERYLLALLYFALKGASWTRRDGWLSLDDVSLWEGIACNDAGQVTELALGGNRLDGTFPTHVGMLSQLQILDFGANALVGTLPSEIGLLTNLELLDVDSNIMSGTIPTQIGRLTLLSTILNLLGNAFSGTLPSEVGLLTSLLDLDFSYNEITGTLSPVLFQLTKLQALGIGNNALRTTLPTEIGLLTGLTHLNAIRSYLVGTIPTEIGLCTTLSSLAFNSNDLTGTLPAELTNLSQLVHLLLPGNLLTGSVPLALCQLEFMEELAVASSCNTFDSTKRVILACPADCCVPTPICA